MDLQKSKSVGPKYTWIRPNGYVKSRLDRFLVSDQWLSLWPDCCQHVLQRDLSDHCPIILQTNMVDWGPKPFRVFDWWLQQKQYQKLVRDTWSNDQQGGWGSIALKNKLKNLKAVLKQWSKGEGWWLKFGSCEVDEFVGLVCVRFVGVSGCFTADLVACGGDGLWLGLDLEG